MHIRFIVHERFESPGAIELWAKQNNHEVSRTNLYAGDALPEDVSEFDVLIVMGGPQSPSTTLKECPYFNASKEIHLIQDAVNADKSVLGVCLGAQLMGMAFGAAHERSPQSEIGVFPITLTDKGRTHSIFRDFPETFSVGHWHNDMPGMTKDAKLLAYSEGCPRQIIQYAPKAYGFQCHLEFTPTVIEALIKHGESDLAHAEKKPYVQDRSMLIQNDFSEMNQFIYRFLDRFLQ